jgi:hypothetical protein
VVYVKVCPGGFMKKCKKCGVDFEGSRCKPCAAKYMREWNANNPEKAREIRSKKYKKYRDQIDEKNNEWAKNNREKSNEIKKAYKQRNREKYLAQQREYANKRYLSNRKEILEKEKSKDRIESYKNWYEKNRERLNKKCLERYHSDEELRIKYRARERVRRALKNGTMIKPINCETCSSQMNLQAHHEDYKDPLMVMWLCRSCHYKLHSKYLQKEEI